VTATVAVGSGAAIFLIAQKKRQPLLALAREHALAETERAD